MDSGDGYSSVWKDLSPLGASLPAQTEEKAADAEKRNQQNCSEIGQVWDGSFGAGSSDCQRGVRQGEDLIREAEEKSRKKADFERKEH